MGKLSFHDQGYISSSLPPRISRKLSSLITPQTKMRQIRITYGISQRALGVLTGLSQSQISLIEMGFCQADDHEKARIARILCVKPEEIWNPALGNSSAQIEERASV